MAIKTVMLLTVVVLGLPVVAVAQSSQEVNEANNPLTPKLTINLQDIYITSLTMGCRIATRTLACYAGCCLIACSGGHKSCA